MIRQRLAILTALLPIVLVACPASDPPAEDAGLVIGVQADPLGGLAGSAHVVVQQDAETVVDTVLPVATALPKEFPLAGRPGARIDVSVDALGGGTTPIITRAASARLVRGPKKLLRVQLDARCVQPPLGVGPVCTTPSTCVAGVCAPRDVGDDVLEDYESTWPSSPPDICRPAHHGDPQVILGTGQSTYSDLGDGQILQLEQGPQGGHHIWIAARMRNLRQSGSTTAISSRVIDDPEGVPPTSYVFTFNRDEGPYCAIWGLRYQVDAAAADLGQAYRRFLGKKLEVTVEVRDTTGASARDTRTIQLADKLLCADGTDACNGP